MALPVCDACNFSVDVSCSLIYETLKHDGHQHPLILSSSRSTRKCSVCNSKSKIFLCSRCKFILNFKRATLPLTVKYEQHEHLFTLCYTVEDGSGEYYCDICEEERDAKNWFYYCADCDYPAHPHCIFGYAKNDEEDFRNIKFGVTAHIRSISIPSLLFVRLRTNFYVMNVINLVMHWLMNAPHVTSIFTKIVLQGGRMI